MKTRLLAMSIVAMLAPTGAQADDVGRSGETAANYSPHADRNYPTNVYFGETHIHSALSTDAGGGTTLMPRDLYRFARGEQVLPNTGSPVKLPRLLDFTCVTEHTDGMGVITDLVRGAPNIMADEQGKKYHEAFTAGGDKAKMASPDIIKQFSQGTLSERTGLPARQSSPYADLA